MRTGLSSTVCFLLPLHEKYSAFDLFWLTLLTTSYQTCSCNTRTAMFRLWWDCNGCSLNFSNHLRLCPDSIVKKLQKNVCVWTIYCPEFRLPYFERFLPCCKLHHLSRSLDEKLSLQHLSSWTIASLSWWCPTELSAVRFGGSHKISYIHNEQYSAQRKVSTIISEISKSSFNSLGSACRGRPGQATSVICSSCSKKCFAWKKVTEQIVNALNRA